MRTRHDELREDVVKFHKAHPQVWKLFCEFTFDRINRGFKYYSAYAIFERVRWETDQVSVEGDQFKLNNNHRTFYTLWFARDYPDHADFFRQRKKVSMFSPPSKFGELTPQDFQ